MRSHFFLLMLFLPFAAAEPFTIENLDANVSMGAFYNIDLYSNATFSSPENCLVSFRDSFNNTVRSFTSDPDYNMIRIDTNGYVKSFVTIDDRFFVGQPYYLVISCGNYTSERTVYIDVAGDFEPNRLLSNVGGYVNTHPEQVMFGTFVFLISSYSLMWYWRRLKGIR